MGQVTLPGNPPIDVVIKRSARARRISLRVSGIDGTVSMTLPRGVSEAQGVDFARQKAGWLRGHLAGRPDLVAVAHGVDLSVAGESLRITPAKTGRAIRVSEGQILVPGPADQVGRRVQSWLKTLARDRLAEASDRYAAALGATYNGISLRDTRSRWGSCSSRGNLSYSWRLILAPPEVLDYVAAHEVAHLREMNHSARFWALVEQLDPAFDASRNWLRVHGAALHRYRFDIDADAG
ncbi:M48 family metallopeptidase [Roseovarius sp. C7]|uniref:M48 family metallopeptidase n=1 Tax=Roseovarius sp. C7 TaxID=3398643 RepID=UPI0039F7260E